jgi:16S rRNA (adenine1518-N6/adenine1519-N6)-dimethyltransferase
MPVIPKKQLGQHFLVDENILGVIERLAGLSADDVVLEIGPGLGVLTLPLLERVGALEVIEIDRDLIPALWDASGHHPGLKILQGDALEVDFRALAPAGARLRLAGNLPYNISTPILFHLLEQCDVIEDMHFLLQKEVVDRMGAAPDTADYGRLTVSLAARAAVTPLFDVGPGAFKPPPQVNSAAVRVRPRAPAFTIRDQAVFDRVVKQAFGQRRKMLSNALKGTVTPAQFEAARIDPKARAETLSAEDFARLSNLL